MTPDDLLKTIAENPVTAGLVGTVLAAVLGFFRPIMGALQSALVRRIDRAWADEHAEDNVEERVRRTASRVRSETIVPLPQAYVEDKVRRTISEAPTPL